MSIKIWTYSAPGHPVLTWFVQRQGSVLVLPASTDDASLRQNQRTTMTKLRLSTKDCRDEPYRWLFATLPRHRWNDENHSITCKEQENVRDSPPSFGLKPLILLMHMLEPTLWPSTNDKLYLCKTTMLGQDAHFWHLNTLLLERAQSFVHLAHPTSSYPGTSAGALNLNKFDNWKMFSHVSPQAWRTHRGRCISISWYDGTRTGKGIRAVEVPADVLPHHHASITSTLVHGIQLACLKVMQKKQAQKTDQTYAARHLL